MAPKRGTGCVRGGMSGWGNNMQSHWARIEIKHYIRTAYYQLDENPYLSVPWKKIRMLFLEIAGWNLKGLKLNTMSNRTPSTSRHRCRECISFSFLSFFFFLANVDAEVPSFFDMWYLLSVSGVGKGEMHVIGYELDATQFLISLHASFARDVAVDSRAKKEQGSVHKLLLLWKRNIIFGLFLLLPSYYWDYFFAFSLSLGNPTNVISSLVAFKQVHIPGSPETLNCTANKVKLIRRTNLFRNKLFSTS